MPVVVASVPGTVRASDRKRVTLANQFGRVTLTATDPETRLGGLARPWTLIDRPGLRPLVVRGAVALRTVDLTALLYDPYHQDANIDRLILALSRVSYAAALVVNSASVVDSGYFYVTDLQVRVLRRAPGTNLPTRAEATMTLTEAVPDEARPSRPLAGRDPAASGGPSGAPARTRIHVVRRGESLTSIAASETGVAANAGRIARENGIRDPRRLTPGTRLRITL